MFLIFLWLWTAGPLLGQTIYGVFPQIAVGGGFSCDLFINTQGDATSNIQISFFDDNGNPLVVDTPFGSTSSLTRSLPAGGTDAIRLSRAGSATPGFAVLAFPFPSSLRATLVVRFEAGGKILTGVGVPLQTSATTFSFAAEVDPGKQVNTGLAIANPSLGSGSSGDQVFAISLIDLLGNLVDSATLPLSLGNHTSLFLDDPRLFAGIGTFKGTVVVTGIHPFGVLSLRLEQGVLSSVAVNNGPVIPPFLKNAVVVPEQENNNTQGTAQALTLPAAVDGTIGSNSDVDFFAFQGQTGQLITVAVETSSMSDFDSVLTIRGPSGQVLAENDQNGLRFDNDSFVQLILPSTGTYSVELDDFFDEGSSNHTYRLFVIGPGGGGGGTTYDGTWSGTTGQSRSIGFTVANGQITSVSFNGQVIGTGCQASFEQTSQVNSAITGNSFNISVTAGPGGVSFTFSGSFSSPSSASGMLRMTLNAIPGVPSCSGTTETTWTASKGGGGGGGSNYDGTWTGTTGQGSPISFTVAGNQITSITFKGLILGIGCQSSIETTSQVSRPISGNSFSVSVSAGAGGVSFTLQGTFSSSSGATGTLRMTLNPIVGVPSCSGTTDTTWTAAKQ